MLHCPQVICVNLHLMRMRSFSRDRKREGGVWRSHWWWGGMALLLRSLRSPRKLKPLRSGRRRGFRRCLRWLRCSLIRNRFDQQCRPTPSAICWSSSSCSKCRSAAESRRRRQARPRRPAAGRGASACWASSAGTPNAMCPCRTAATGIALVAAPLGGCHGLCRVTTEAAVRVGELARY